MYGKQVPLVSVAIITYNQKDFLYECIESILEQDYPNFEIVIADDASTDGTQDMLREYNRKYPGKFVLKLAKRNQGITANSNAAHFACSGKYVAWMGGDDLMLPRKLSKQVIFLENNPQCTICYHDLDVFDSKTKQSLYLFSKKNKPRQGDIRTLIKFGCFNGGCATMVRKDQTPSSGFNSLIPVASDWCYWIESLASGGEIRYIPEVLARYRRHENNITNRDLIIGQNSIDHLNTCNYILSKYPEFFNEAMSCYSKNIRSLRHRLPYLSALIFSLKVSFDLRSFFAGFVFVLTVGKVRL